MANTRSMIYVLKAQLESNPDTTPEEITSLARDNGISEPSSKLLSISKIMSATMLQDFEIPNTTPPSTPYHPFSNNYSKLFNWNKGKRRFFTLILNKDGFIHHGSHGFNAYRDNESGQIYVVDNDDAYAELMRDESTYNKAHESWIKNGSMAWIKSFESVQAPIQLDLLKCTNELLVTELLLKSDHFTHSDLEQLKQINYFKDSYHPTTFTTILNSAIDFKSTLTHISTHPTIETIANTTSNTHHPLLLNDAIAPKTN